MSRTSSILVTNCAASFSGTHQHCFRQGCSSFFLSALRTVSTQTCVTSRRFFNSSTKSCSVQYVWPSGALLQQIATRCALNAH